MLNQKIQDAFNKHLNSELYSSYLYLSMTSYFESQNLKGMANWMKIQVQEELIHVMKFFDFINERDGNVILTQVEAPKIDWKSPLEAFEKTYEHEIMVTGFVNELVNLTIRESDHAANTFLQWFVTEQVEEESSSKTIVDKLKLVGDNSVALFMIDGELARRTFTPAAV